MSDGDVEPPEPEPEPEPEDAPEPTWWLYLLRGRAGRTYVGITVDLERRVEQHNGEQPGGAKSTRAGRPWALVRQWGPFDRSRASQLEYALKRVRGARRDQWEPPALD